MKINKVKSVLALAAAFCGLQLSAATPVAVWDGDFSSLTRDAYTWTASAGTTVAADMVTIGSDGGLTMTVPTTSTIYSSYTVTVIMDAEVPSFAAESPLVDIYANGSYVTLTSEGTTLRQRWNFGGDWGSSSWTPGRQKIAVTYKASNPPGTRSFVNGANVMAAAGLFSSAGNLKTLKLGCYAKDSTTKVAAGLKIYKVAIFDTNISDDEVKSYKFPSEQPYNSVVSVNFGANTSARTVSGDPGAVVADSSWYNRSAANESNVTIGTAKLTHTSSGLYSNDNQSKSYNKGYLDDYANGTTPVTVTVSSLANGYYDLVIYCSSDDATRFSYKTVNGKDYTYDSSTGAAKEGTASWGSNATSSTEPGNHALLIEDVKVTNGSIAISSLRKDESSTVKVRGCISAIQFCNKKVYSATISDNKTFGDISWEQGSLVAAADTTAIVTVDGAASAGEVDITFNDPSVTLKKLKLVGSRDVRLVANSALLNIASIDRTGLTGKLTYAWPVSALPMTDANIYYGAGAGSEGAHASISIAANKYLNLRGTTPFYLGTTAGESATPYAMTFTDATVHCLGWSGLAVGQATVTVEGSSTVSTERVILSQGMNGLTSALVVKGTASVTSTGTTDADENTNSVMFGHWNGPSTFTLQDSATFTSASQVLVGKTGNNQTINIAGGTFTAKGIKTSDNATGSNAINLSGGKLVLGSVGITSYSSTTIPVNVTGNAVIEASATMTISQSVSLGSGKALTLTTPANVSMSASGVISGAGSIVKDGAGQVVLSGNNTFTGGTTINAGVLVLGNASALGTGTVTIGENGQLDLNGKSVTISSLAGSGTICNSSETTAYVNGVPVKTGKSYTISEGKVSITLGANETLTLTSIPAANTVKIGGAGRVEYANATIPTLPAGLWAEDWTGTFAYSGCDTNKTDWDPTSYYNGTNSVFEFGGKITYSNSTLSKKSSYFRATEFSLGELILKSGSSIGFNDGYTTPTKESTTVNNYCFTKLSGSGTLTIDSTTTASPGIKFGDVSEFTGTISNTSSSDSGYRIILGEGELKAVGDDPAKAAIHFTGDTTLNSITLSAKSGIKVTDDAVVTVVEGKTPQCSSGVMALADGSSLVFEDKDSRLWANGGISVDSSASIPLKVVNSAGLNKDTYLITWTTSAQPAGTFALDLGTSRAKGEHGLSAEKTTTGLKLNEVATETYYEVEGGETTTFDNTWLEGAGVKGTTTEATQANLNAENANGIKMSDVYLMGYEAKDAQNAAVILKPSQAQSNGETISLSVAGVPNETRNGAVVTYKALASASRDWTNPSVEETMDTLSVDMALPTSGVLYYRVQASVALP